MRFAIALQLPARLPLGLPAVTARARLAADPSTPGRRLGSARAAGIDAVPRVACTEILDRPAPHADALDALDLDERVRLIGEW